MGRTCTVCASDRRQEVDLRLVEGASFRNIAKQSHLSPAAVYRHREHVPAKVAKAHVARETIEADALMAQRPALYAEAKRLGLLAEERGDIRAALQAIRELSRLVELDARIYGQIKEAHVSVNIVASVAWTELRAKILAALTDFPEARWAVAAALQGRDDG